MLKNIVSQNLYLAIIYITSIYSMAQMMNLIKFRQWMACPKYFKVHQQAILFFQHE